MAGRIRNGATFATGLWKTLFRPAASSSPVIPAAADSVARRALTTGSLTGDGSVRTEITTSHTAKWMQDTSRKSPMELINEVPPIKVEGRIVCCEGDSNPALGHPIEFICLDLDAPAVCKYCGLRYVQDHGYHHH
ncbi:OLC1v1021005C1 [Oldenlandia corymbosa var. corymbosa]|uniref:OLC1v1021005C1 n=1 Tax=Oldenlandia corymbosa var. corymbosa TaxID=529605 RepID=A0AAV1BUQ4_OLDCO|nr:OLC1v1021005C1 [Oldenlandia corymbosa var. corymbosa]